MAILLVVASNYDWGYPRGGFLGVDVFFMLSGFLITALLLAEHAQDGRIRLRNFYGRRALRLLPALLALIAALNAYAWIFKSSEVRHITIVSSAFALFYVGNWYLAFGAEQALTLMGSLAPTWSLSVEEQFYLLWPIVLIGLLATSIQWWRLAIIMGAGALAASAWRSWLWFHGADWPRLYFGTDTRGDSLLVGCALGMFYMSGVVMKMPEGATGALASAGLGILFILVSFSQQNTGPMYAGGGYTLAALSAGAILLHLVRTPEGRLAKVFSARWLTWIGVVSYGIYLWHMPIARLLDPANIPDLPRIAVEFFRVVAIFIAVTTSYYVIERPFLLLKRRIARV